MPAPGAQNRETIESVCALFVQTQISRYSIVMQGSSTRLAGKQSHNVAVLNMDAQRCHDCVTKARKQSAHANVLREGCCLRGYASRVVRLLYNAASSKPGYAWFQPHGTTGLWRVTEAQADVTGPAHVRGGFIVVCLVARETHQLHLPRQHGQLECT